MCYFISSNKKNDYKCKMLYNFMVLINFNNPVNDHNIFSKATFIILIN